MAFAALRCDTASTKSDIGLPDCVVDRHICTFPRLKNDRYCIGLHSDLRSTLYIRTGRNAYRSKTSK